MSSFRVADYASRMDESRCSPPPESRTIRKLSADASPTRLAVVRPKTARRTCDTGVKQTTQFSTDEDWIFASPLKLGGLPYSYAGFWRELQRAAKVAGIGHLGTHAFRHTYRSWLDAVGTLIAVQQKLMRHSDIRTTMNIHGDVVTDEMGQAHSIRLLGWH